MAQFPADVSDTLRDLAKQVRSNDGRRRKAFLEIGRCAAEAQALLAQHGNGGLFSAWCRECKLTRSKAYDAIAIFENFGQCPDCRHQPTESLRIVCRHPGAVQEARARIEKGDRLTIKEARKILAKHKPPKESPRFTTQTFEVTGGTVTIRLKDPNADTTAFAVALSQANRALHADAQPAEPPKRASLFGRSAA